MHSFYTNVSAKQLIDHLDTNCGGLHPSELVKLPTEMMTYYTMADSILEYINMLEEVQRKLARAKLPMSNNQLLTIASTTVLASKHSPRPTDEWEAKPCDNKTWDASKAHYCTAHLACKRQQLAAGQPVFHGSANAVTTANNAPITPETPSRLDGYLENLAAAATTGKTTLTQLIENKAALTASVAALIASVTALTVAYTLLANGKPPTTPYPTPACKISQLTKMDPNPMGYCWMHGYQVRVGHTSSTCTSKAEGHNDAANSTNTMGGSTRNKPAT